jgi:hypothetical protein
VLLAFAVRAASVLVGICSGCGVFVTFPTVGIIGVVRLQARATGCVLIGPVVGLILGMLDNSFLPNCFAVNPRECDAQRRVVERCDAPRRAALPTVMSIGPTRPID